MKQLTIDTSAHLCAAAIFDTTAHEVLAERTMDIGRGHAEILMGLIDECLLSSDSTYDDLDRIAVTTGPGSFTGVRVGLSAAKGISLGLSIPLIGISTLEANMALAREQKDGNRFAALIDARRDQAYCQIEEERPFVATYADLAKRFRNYEGVVCGSGVPLLLENFELSLSVAHTEGATPISIISILAASLPDSSNPLRPLYLRSADAKPQTEPLITTEFS